MRVPANVYSDYHGFRWLCALSQALVESPSTLQLDFRANQFLDGNLCAVIGALFYQHQLDLNAIVANHRIPAAVLRTLSMNEFAPAHGGVAMPDDYDTTVKYRRFEFEQAKNFADYLNAELLNKDLPLLDSTKKAFRIALLEVFNNCRHHSQATNGVFSCGQHFPTKEIINYTLVDLGIGFGQSVSQRVGKIVSSEKAIPWAVKAGHSSRENGNFGGMGLDEIHRIIAANEGTFQILSGDAFWEWKDGDASVRLVQPFPGTIVNLQVNVALDKHREMDRRATEKIAKKPLKLDFDKVNPK